VHASYEDGNESSIVPAHGSRSCGDWELTFAVLRFFRPTTVMETVKMPCRGENLKAKN